jgi:hypothetical protein
MSMNYKNAAQEYFIQTKYATNLCDIEAYCNF